MHNPRDTTPSGSPHTGPPLKVVDPPQEPPADYDDLTPSEYRPHNGSENVKPPDVEAALLGALLLHPHHAEPVKDQLAPDDFHHPTHGHTWHAIHTAVDTHGPDPALVTPTVIAALAKQYPGGRNRSLPTSYLPNLITNAGEPLHIDQYVTTIRDTARRRFAAAAGRRLTQAAENGTIEETDAQLARALDDLDQAVTRYGDVSAAALTVHVPNVKEFLTTSDTTYDWLIPGLLERGDRVILTGGEGSGKSTLARQLGVTCAAGLHPFHLTEITPIRVLIIDFENPERLLERAIGRLYGKVANRLPDNNLRIISRTQGIDLQTPEDRAWMTTALNIVKPDLLITGPHYKMTSGDTDKEKESKPVALFLDQLRADHNCAVWLEAHVGNEQPGSKNRPERPFGWSGWRRWPEFGLYLAPDGQLKHWRGDRDQRSWPAVLTRGREWPWETTTDETEQRWQAIRQARDNAGVYLSYNDLIRETGLDKNAIARTIGKGMRHVHDWTLLNGNNPYTKHSTEEDTW